jgi:restriction system protein
LKLKMAEKSLFATLLRSPWWVSMAVAAVLALVVAALLPAEYRIVGVLSVTPFVVIGALAAWRQRGRPSAAQVTQTVAAVSVLTWPQFAALLEQAFKRDGYTVQRGHTDAFDFALERNGRTTLAAARRWKSARTGLEALRALQAARDGRDDAPHALLISLGELTDSARRFAAEHRMAVWQPDELAQALRGLVALKPNASR